MCFGKACPIGITLVSHCASTPCIKICLLLVLLPILGFVGFQRLPSELIPIEDEGYMMGSIYADNSVTDAVRESWFKNVEAVLKKVPEGERVLTGVWQDQWMWWYLILKPSEDRSRNTLDIAKTLRLPLAGIVGPEVQINDNPGVGGDDSFKVIVQYGGTQERLVEALYSIMAEARKEKGFDAIYSEQTWEKPRLRVTVDRALASELGVSIDAIEDTLYTFLSGRKAADFNFQGLDYDVQVRAPLEYK